MRVPRGQRDVGREGVQLTVEMVIFTDNTRGGCFRVVDLMVDGAPALRAGDEPPADPSGPRRGLGSRGSGAGRRGLALAHTSGAWSGGRAGLGDPESRAQREPAAPRPLA
jgi:hypothetical protein